MLQSLKSELRKLISIRSTYVIILICVLLTGIFAFWAAGIRAVPESQADPLHLYNQIIGAVGAVSLILALIGVLMITQEYRFNTIMYTLSASNSRAKTFFAKVILAIAVSMILTVFFALLSPLFTRLGLAVGGHTVVAQTFYFQDIWWRGLSYGVGYMLSGLLLGFLFRSQVGAIVTLLLAQATIEPLLGMLLKDNAIYLPFSALNSVLSESAQISSIKALVVFLVYMIIGWTVAFWLFLRRDAN